MAFDGERRILGGTAIGGDGATLAVARRRGRWRLRDLHKHLDVTFMLPDGNYVLVTLSLWSRPGWDRLGYGRGEYGPGWFVYPVGPMMLGLRVELNPAVIPGLKAGR